MFKVKLNKLGSVDEQEYTRVLCVCRYKGKWLFAKNIKRGVWEIPGGHIEEGENWHSAAKRELFEETGATKMSIEPICDSSISSYALLCYAEIEELDDLPEFEMSEIGLFDGLPDELSFPETHTVLFSKVLEVKGYK